METLLLLIPLIAAALLVARLMTVTTVYEYERGVRFEKGRLLDELGPGRYRHLSGQTQIWRVDLRQRQLAVNGQEVLSRDGVAVKASLTATYRVVDAKASILKSENMVTAIYTELQQALRSAVSGQDVEVLLSSRGELGAQILQHSQAAVAPLGVALDQVAIRDLTLPGDLKKIFAQVVKARQEGLAALERARGETAALRHLANAAQMVERNPHLMQLRLLQTVGQQTGSTLVVGMPPGTMPFPVRAASPGEPPPAPPIPDEL